MLAAMGAALKEQLRQFLWLNPMACFYLRGRIGVHKEGIPPSPEFLLRLLLCLKETNFSPVPLLVVCPDLSAFIHPYDNLHRLSPYRHVFSPLLDASSCPPPRSSLNSGSIWFLGLVTLGESLIASPSSLAFFPSAFFAAFSYRFASSCLSFYSCNVFPVLVVVLIAASCTEMEIGGAYVDRLKSLQGTQRGSVTHGHFLRKNLIIPF
jgi:hypothetical protein